MKILMSFIVATLFASGVLVVSEDTNGTDTTPSTTPVSSPTTQTTMPTPESTAATSTTTEPTPVTTSIPSSPTTDSSTNIPTTDSSTNSTTTDAPTSTKAPIPTPPTPSDCSWNITQNNVTCMRVMMKALFTISTGDKEYIALSQNASAKDSDCQLTNDTQKLVLSEQDYTFTMIFAKEAGKVFVNSTSFSYSLPETKGTEATDKKLFIVKFGNSYKCKSAENVLLGNVTMEISDVQIQAFGEKDNTGFGAAEDCEADDKVSDAVPIAVGCALAALIIVVLIAYLVGRRRSRQKGYQSV